MIVQLVGVLPQVPVIVVKDIAEIREPSLDLGPHRASQDAGCSIKRLVARLAQAVRLCRPRRQTSRAHPRGKPGFSTLERGCGRETDLYGAFPVKRLLLGLLTVLCSERERPFFIPSPAIQFPERAEGVQGPKR